MKALPLTENRVGKALNAAERRTSLSIGPLRDGLFAAKLWRIWSQGDEFYAGQRDGLSRAKVSFHRNGKWHYDIGQHRQDLCPAASLTTPGWSLALQLKFLLRDAPMPSPPLTRFKRSTNVVGIETTRGSKLLVNLLCAPEGTSLHDYIPAGFDGIRMLAMRLRSMGVVIVTANLAPLEPAEKHRIATSDAAQVTTTQPISRADGTNAELMEVYSRSTGNVIAIVPLGLESFVCHAGE
jgi:hypothetical protein